MKNILGFIFILSSAFFSCKNKGAKEPEKNIITDTLNYYPVNFFIGEDIRAAIQSGARIYKTVEINKVRMDSVLIDTSSFVALANQFLQKDITQSPTKHFYKESIFRSLSTNSIIMNYTSINPDLDIRSVDASINEDGNKLNRVDIRVISTKNDSSLTENYSWLPGNKFYITRYAEGKDGKGISSITTVTWHK